MRDIKADYQRALIEEYEGYRRAGRDADAEQVAGVLRDRYGHDVTNGKDAKKAAEKPEKSDTPERTDAERPPEDAAPAKPARAAAKRTSAKKPAGE